VATLAGVAAALCAASLAGVRFTPFVSNTGPALALAAATVASRRSRRTSLASCVAAAVAVSAAAILALWTYPEQDQDAVQLFLVVVGWLAGDTLRVRREYRQDLDRARIRQQTEHDQRIRAEERLRLSRDVHDIVSHTLGMITVRAGVARFLLADGLDEPAQPARAREALEVIETASRSALDELRRILRQTRPAGPDEVVTPPTLADMAVLVETVRGNGLNVDLRVIGSARSSPPPSALPAPRTADPKGSEASEASATSATSAAWTGDGAGGKAQSQLAYPLALETSAYRVVQEALTNVTRHAAAEHAWVAIDHRHDELVVTVLDDGRGPAPTTEPGIGLAGMRERLELFGGVLDAGPRPDGGFAVVARFPVARDEQ